MLRCPACRSRRTTFTSLLKHIEESGHKLCGCGGYPYAHRPGSPCCVQNPMSAVRVAAKQPGITDEELQEIELDCVWHNPGKPMPNWRD